MPGASPDPGLGAAAPAGDLPNAPLANRLRPRAFDQVIGQRHLLGEGGALRVMLDAGRLSSIIFWGP
ncbi:MAG: recombination factor protein RarA, partial [Pseudomonadota bacterium]